jgi:hypothetical protein
LRAQRGNLNAESGPAVSIFQITPYCAEKVSKRGNQAKKTNKNKELEKRDFCHMLIRGGIQK